MRKDKSSGHYVVEWEHSSLGTTKLDANVLFDAVNLADALRRKQQKETTGFPLTSPIFRAMTEVTDDDERGPPLLDGDEEEETDEEHMLVDTQAVFFKVSTNPMTNIEATDLVLPSLSDNDTTDDDIDLTNDEGLQWSFNKALNPPLNVSTGERTTIKDNKRMKFITPLSSFLAFVPIEFWKLYLFQTNTYGKDKYATKVQDKEDAGQSYTGRIWRSISLQEFMTLFGILIQMTTRPTPGQRYTDCWENPSWHPYTSRMDKYRFIEIRSVLHMLEWVPNCTSVQDSLFKVRPLFNVLKKTMGLYVNPGSELSLDESSIACRSKYGRNLIFYNNTKPCDKYHFRFYVMTDVENYVCLRIWVHTKNESDIADGLPPRLASVADEFSNKEDETVEAEEQSKLVRLVLDMAKPWYQTGRVVNMDNYYTSPTVFIELKKNGVFARGICRSNRRMFPESIQFSKTEARNSERGSMKVVANIKHKMAAMGWVDGHPVHFLTTADGTKESIVQRRVRDERKSFKAPMAVRKFNHGMQGVDRFDQLVVLFSLAKNHCFKKYYNKLTMSLLDFALVNAEIHYFMVNDDAKKRKNHRLRFREDLCHTMYETDWNTYSQED